VGRGLILAAGNIGIFILKRVEARAGLKTKPGENKI